MSPNMKQVLVFIPLVALSCSAQAAERSTGAWIISVLFSFGPLIFLLALMPFVMRLSMRRTNRLTERNAEANERIAKSLEEIVELLRSK